MNLIEKTTPFFGFRKFFYFSTVHCAPGSATNCTFASHIITEIMSVKIIKLLLLFDCFFLPQKGNSLVYPNNPQCMHNSNDAKLRADALPSSVGVIIYFVCDAIF